MKTRFFQYALLVLVLCGGVGWLFGEPILNGWASSLMVHDSPQPTQALVVLAGSRTGNRIKAAAELYRKKMAPLMVMSGYEVYPGTFSYDLMSRYAVSLGVPEGRIETGVIRGQISTWGEAEANLQRLREKGIQKFILVTSTYHTKRAQRIYKNQIEKQGLGMEFLVFAAEDPEVPISGWWRHRTALKAIFFESIKTMTTYFEYGI